MGSTPAPGTYSASRVSAIIGLNRYQTPFEAWQVLIEEIEPGINAKLGYKIPDPPDNASIRWGRAFEDAIIKLAEEREGCKIGYKEDLFQADKNGKVLMPNLFGINDGNPKRKPFLSCHIDGAFSDISNGVILHEGKTTHDFAYRNVRREIKQQLDENGEITNEVELIRQWGEPGTDQVPQEYQVQAAVQRICTSADLVKLGVLVFPKAPQEFEDMGWKTRLYFGKNHWIEKFQYKVEKGDYLLGNEKNDWYATPDFWSVMFRDIGNFHTYNLPRNERLESEIIRTIQEFNAKYVQTRTPPEPTTYEDLKRILWKPAGTIIATPELKRKAVKYSEITRQLGSGSPLKKHRDQLKVEILKDATKISGESHGEDQKLLIIDPDGGNVLASLAVDKNGKLTFRAKRAN